MLFSRQHQYTVASIVIRISSLPNCHHNTTIRSFHSFRDDGVTANGWQMTNHLGRISKMRRRLGAFFSIIGYTVSSGHTVKCRASRAERVLNPDRHGTWVTLDGMTWCFRWQGQRDDDDFHSQTHLWQDCTKPSDTAWDFPYKIHE